MHPMYRYKVTQLQFLTARCQLAPVASIVNSPCSGISTGYCRLRIGRIKALRQVQAVTVRKWEYEFE